MRRDNTEQPEVAPVILRGLWFLVRLPVFTLLVILEPVVALVLGGLALAGVLTTIFFVLIHAPHFPAWTMLTLSIGFGLALMFYEALLRVFSGEAAGSQCQQFRPPLNRSTSMRHLQLRQRPRVTRSPCASAS